MFTIIYSGKLGAPTFPLFLFLAAKLCVLYAVAEICMTLMGRYETKDESYSAISRAISSIGMAVCFILLVGAFDVAKKVG